MMLEQKPPMYTQQFAPPPSHMAQRGYPGAPMQEPGFHPMSGQMGPRQGYPMMRMQARPGLRPASVPNQPNTLRLQLQHRLQSQQVHTHTHIYTDMTLQEVMLFIDCSLFLMQPHCLISSCVIVHVDESCVFILEVDILASLLCIRGTAGTFRSTCHLLVII